ncbi:MAG: linear amide C-N hydrolase, partial [Ruminococcus sp.]
MNKVKKTILIILLGILAVVVVAVVAFVVLYFTRFQTIGSIEQLTDYKDGYNLYRMDVEYDYSIDDIIDYGIKDDQTMIDAIVKEALPMLPVSIKAPEFGCTAFTLTDNDGDVHMGRNYDFSLDTSSMLVYCEPEDGYKSMAFAALDNVSANVPDENIKSKMASLTAPFVCLDGMNEKGVSIAVLTLDSEPVHQNTGKPVISTSLAIRLVLDKAATTEEAVELLKNYDMISTCGRDYHFYINDASGDCRVIEYDVDGEPRELIDTKSEAVTNFFIRHKDEVLPN